MAVISGSRTTANQATASVKVTMEDVVDILPIDDVPLTSRLPSVDTDNIKFEWLEDGLDPQAVTVSTTSALASTTVVLDTGQGTSVRPRDVYKRRAADGRFGTLMFEVASVSTDTLTLAARPGFSTTDEALADGDVLELVGQVPIEGADPQDQRSTDLVGRFNYTEIFQEKISASDTAQKVTKFGPKNPMDDNRQKKTRELAIRFEKSLIHGVRYQSVDKKQRMTGGLLYHIASNKQSDIAANLEAMLNRAIRSAYDVGATPRTLYCSPGFIGVFSALYSEKVHVTPDQRRVGMNMTVYTGPYGEVELVMDRYMPGAMAIGVQEEFAKQRPFSGRSWFYEELAKTGDSDSAQIVGEYGFELKNEKAHFTVSITDAGL